MDNSCASPGCLNKVRCKGYCRKHYEQIRQHGRLTPELERAKRGTGGSSCNASVRLDKTQMEQLKNVAEHEGVGPHTLARKLIVEGIRSRLRQNET